jgi:hypothetical protein
LKKPDPIGVQTLMLESGIPAGRTLMIGDSSVDIQTARNARIASCGVTYGFAPETLSDPVPDRVLDRMEELADWLRVANGFMKIVRPHPEVNPEITTTDSYSLGFPHKDASGATSNRDTSKAIIESRLERTL